MRLGYGSSWRKTKLRVSREESGRGYSWAMRALAYSTSLPYCTPEGQAVSQARQSRHLSMWSTKLAESGAAICVGSDCATCWTLTIWRMRPRGESASRFQSLYVGQALRHRPQWTQRA